MYAFLPEDEGRTNIEVQALDENSQVIHQRNFNGVPMKLNQLTRYTGDFFAEEKEESTTNFTLSLDNDVWNEDEHIY